jgi:hypothetical protein
MVGIIATATLVFPIVLWRQDEVRALADTRLLNGPDMADRKYISV